MVLCLPGGEEWPAGPAQPQQRCWLEDAGWWHVGVRWGGSTQRFIPFVASLLYTWLCLTACRISTELGAGKRKAITCFMCSQKWKRAFWFQRALAATATWKISTDNVDVGDFQQQGRLLQYRASPTEAAGPCCLLSQPRGNAEKAETALQHPTPHKNRTVNWDFLMPLASTCRQCLHHSPRPWRYKAASPHPALWEHSLRALSAHLHHPSKAKLHRNLFLHMVFCCQSNEKLNSGMRFTQSLHKKCSFKNRISSLLLAALQRPTEVKEWPPLLYPEHTLGYRTVLFHTVI